MRARLRDGALGLVVSFSLLAGGTAYGWPGFNIPTKSNQPSSSSSSSSSGGVVTGQDIKNPVTEKWYEFGIVSGNYKCAAKGLLKTLIDEPMECRKSLEVCKAGADAIQGKLDPAAKGLFLDLIKMWPDKRNSRDRQFMMSCGQLGPSGLWELGMSGLAFIGGAAELPELLKLGDPEFLKNMKGEFVRTLWFMGAKDQIPVIMKNIQVKGYTEYARIWGLEYLARWKSDAAVDFCFEALKQAESDDTHKSCVIYLGRMKATKATPLIVRKLESFGELGVRALGWMGDPAGVDPLEEQLAKYQPGQYTYRIPIIAALINLGKTAHMKELLGYISKGVAGAREAAMETVVISDPKLASQINTALFAAASKKGSDWQPSLFSALALAQRGDARAIPILKKGLAGSNGDIRDAIIDGIGADENPFGAAFWRRGNAIVANSDLIAALMEYYDLESDNGRRKKALVAALNIRAMMR